MLFLSPPGRNFSHIGFPSGKRRGIFTSNLSLRCSLDVGLSRGLYPSGFGQ